MAQEEIVQILKFQTNEAVKSISDLRNNIKEYKQQLEGLDIGTEEYQQTLKQLTENQKALRQAMFATGSSMEQVAEQAKGVGNSYNALVNQMAELKKQWRAAESDAVRNALASQIKNINTQLKDMDAEIGNHQRNVGNYTQSMVDAFGAVGGGARSLVAPIQGVTNGFKALSATPVIAVLGLLVSVMDKVISSLKSSEANIQAVTAAFAPFKAIGDLATKSMQSFAKGLAKVGEWLQKVIKSLGLWTDEMQAHVDLQQKQNDLAIREREIMVENAKKQQEIAELREKAKEADLYTEKERLDFLERAMQLEQDISNNERELAQTKLDIAKEESKFTENSTEQMNELAQLEVNLIQVETKYQDTMRGYQKERQTLLKKTKEDIQEVIDKTIELETITSSVSSGLADADEILAQNIEGTTDKAIKAALERSKMMSEGMMQISEYEEKQEEERLERIERLNDAKVATTQNAISSMMSLYEAFGGESAKQAKAYKALATAQAIIDTYKAANEAFSAMASIPVVGPAMGAVAAASAIAAGLANVRAINAVSTSGTSRTSTSASSSAIVSAPAVIQQVQTTRTLTSASEEERLNKMASDQRVYVVYSDIETAGTKVAVTNSESTF